MSSGQHGHTIRVMIRTRRFVGIDQRLPHLLKRIAITHTAHTAHGIRLLITKMCNRVMNCDVTLGIYALPLLQHVQYSTFGIHPLDTFYSPLGAENRDPNIDPDEMGEGLTSLLFENYRTFESCCEMLWILISEEIERNLRTLLNVEKVPDKRLDLSESIVNLATVVE